VAAPTNVVHLEFTNSSPAKHRLLRSLRRRAAFTRIDNAPDTTDR